MTDEQTRELHTLRAKARGEASDAALVGELLAIAKLLNDQRRHKACDAIHRAIARIEGPEFDGVLT